MDNEQGSDPSIGKAAGWRFIYAEAQACEDISRKAPMDALEATARATGFNIAAG